MPAHPAPWGALVYLVGEPGAGKSTLMAALTAGFARLPRRKPFAHDLLIHRSEPVAVELGRRRATFSGTDALSMSVAPLARDWIAAPPCPLVLGEGDRLASLAFLQSAGRAGITPVLVWLRPPAELAERRRAARGSQQSPTWIAGRATKAANLAARAADAGLTVHTITATHPPEQLAAHLIAAVPALAVLGTPEPSRP